MLAQNDNDLEFKFDTKAMGLYDHLSDEFFNHMIKLCEERVREKEIKIITTKMMKSILRQALVELNQDKKLE